MSDPLVPNYKKEVGRLATDRFDFEDHVEGKRFRHNADAIDVIPNLVVGTTVTHNVLEALEALRDAAEPPVISDATTASKGIIQLAGDIAGVATNIVVTRIQGKPISSLTPSGGDVLTWDGIASVWHPAAPTNVFSAAGDLAGNNVLQNVIGWTGTQYSPSVGFVVRASNSVVEYVNSVTPLITQETAPINNGFNTTIRAQSAAGINKNGGDIILAGGAPGSGGLKGGVKLQLTSSILGGYPQTTVANSAFNMVELSEPAIGRRVLSLCHPLDVTTIDMPANTGDMVMYVRDAASIPSTGNPSNGTIVYSTGGQLWVKQQDGNNFSVGSIPNPSIWGPSGQQTYTNRNYVQSTTSAALAFSFNLPDQTATRVDVIFIGKKVGGNDSAQFNLSIGYTRHLSAPVAVGTLTNADPRNTAGASGWTIPNVTVSGNTLQVFTGFSAGTTIQWLVITQLTMSSSS